MAFPVRGRSRDRARRELTQIAQGQRWQTSFESCPTTLGIPLVIDRNSLRDKKDLVERAALDGPGRAGRPGRAVQPPPVRRQLALIEKSSAQRAQLLRPFHPCDGSSIVGLDPNGEVEPIAIERDIDVFRSMTRPRRIEKPTDLATGQNHTLHRFMVAGTAFKPVPQMDGANSS